MEGPPLKFSAPPRRSQRLGGEVGQT